MQLKRLRDWAQARINAVILPVVKRCVTEVAQPVDYQRLALQITTMKEFMRELQGELAGDSELAEAVADRIDASDIAYHIDAGDVASHVEVDSSDLDIDTDSIVQRLDYRELCRCLISTLRAGV